MSLLTNQNTSLESKKFCRIKIQSRMLNRHLFLDLVSEKVMLVQSNKTMLIYGQIG